MPDPKQIIADQDNIVDTEIAPVVPVPVVPDVPEPEQTSRSETASNNLLYSTLHQSMRINLDVSFNATSSMTSSVVVNVNNGNRTKLTRTNFLYQ